MKINCYFIIPILIAYIINIIEAEKVGVVELFRHGARTPLRFFDIVENLFTPYTEGELTHIGYNQLKLLGFYIKSNYFSEANKKNKFEENSHLIYSLDIPRCIKSSIYHFQTLFDNDLVTFYPYNISDSDFDKAINQEIIFDYISDFKEYFKFNSPNEEDEYHVGEIKINLLDPLNDKLLAPRECFKLDKEFTDETYIVLKEDREILNKLNKTFPIILEQIVKSEYDIMTIKNMWDLITSTDFHYPNYFSNMENEIKDIFNKYKMKYNYEYLSSDSNLKLLVSKLFKNILKMFDQIINDGVIQEKNIKFLFLSGRDVNIVDIINNIIDHNYIRYQIRDNYKDINVKRFFLPDFASSLIFELHKFGDYYIKIIYNGEENFLNLIRVNGEKIIYDSLYGIKYVQFKKMLSSRINIEYLTKICS